VFPTFKNENNIHFFVHYKLSSWSRETMDVLKWIAVPKPLGNYQVHFHFIPEFLPIPETNPYERPLYQLSPWNYPRPKRPPGVPRPTPVQKPVPESQEPVQKLIKTIIYDSD
jgi:hypothetical protein